MTAATKVATMKTKTAYKTIEQVESSDKAATKAAAYKRMSKMYPEGKARRRNQKYKRRQGAQENAI